jgi:hypothetical protein
VVAVVEHRDGLAFENVAGELEQRHVGPPPRAVDGEEAQARHRKAEEMGVGMRHQLVRLLGRAVKAHRMIDSVADAEGELAVRAIDRARRGIDEMLHLRVAAAFEHMQEAPDIGVDISVRMLQRIAHAGLRGEMDDALRLLLGEDRAHDFLVGEVGLDEMKSVAPRQPREARLFERDIIIGAHIVEPNDLIAAIEQPGRRVKTDEAGGAGDQNAHVTVALPLRPLCLGERGHKSHRRFRLSTAGVVGSS